MLVTGLEAVSKTRMKVYIDYEYAFVLSNKECILYDIKEGFEISDQTYQEITEELLLPKAKRKAMDILVRMDRSESELFSKLLVAGFSERISNEAISYVKKFNYINDYRYACNYIRSRKSSKSIKMMTLELSRKGIDKEMVEQALEECSIDETGALEEEAVKREIRRRCDSVSDLTYEKRMKITVALYRKGFSNDVIRNVFDDLKEKEYMD